jgi:glycosyltransferase involved in cell wall biosynthesis
MTEDLFGLIPEYVTVIDLKNLRTSKSFCKILRITRSKKPNFIFTTHSRLALVVSLIKLFSHAFHHIARMQNMPSLEVANKRYGCIKQKLYSIGFKKADTVIAQTEEMKKDAIKYFHVKKNKVIVMNNSLDTVYILNSLKSAVNPFEKKELVAVAAGRISKQKGYETLICSIPKIIKMRPEFQLHILGRDRGEKENLVKLAEDLGIRNHIYFHGHVDNPYPYYYYCDIFVLSSVYEGYPNVLLENYYLNTPIVATDCVPVVKQLIKEGINGYICNVGDSTCLADRIIRCMDLKRNNIKNEYRSPVTLNSVLDSL